MKIKYQYTIEFELFGKAMRVTVEAHDEAAALDAMFATLRAKTKIKSAVKPANDHNRVAGMGNELFEILNG